MPAGYDTRFVWILRAKPAPLPYALDTRCTLPNCAFLVTLPPLSTSPSSSPGDSLGRKVGVVVASRLLTTLVDLLTMVLIVHLLSKPELAIVRLLLIVYGTARYLATFGFPDSILYFFDRVEKGAQRRLVLQTCGLLAATALAASGLIMLASLYADVLLSSTWTVAQRAAVSDYLPWIALVCLLEIPTWPTTNVLIALDRQREAGRYEVATSVLLFASLLGPLLLGYEIETAVYGLVFYAVIRFVLSAAWLARVLPPGISPLPRHFRRQQVRFSIPLGLNGAVNRLSKYFDSYVIAVMLPAIALADYQVGAQEIPFVSVIPAAVGSVLVSRYAAFQLAGDRDALIALWHRAALRTLLYVVPLTVLFIAVAGDFIHVVFGAQYRSAVLLFQIYNVILLHRIVSYGSVLQGFGDTRGILLITLSVLAANAVLSVPLTFAFGAVGTATGTLLASAVGWVQALRRIGRHMGLPARRVLPFGPYARMLGVAAAAGLAVWTARTWLYPDLSALAGLLLSSGLYAVIFGAAAAALGVVTWADWQRIRAAFSF